MPIEHADKWADFGLGGMVIAALFGFIWFLVREHRAERREWLDAFKIQSQQMIDVARESNDVTRALTSAVERQASRRRADDR
ncbi:hypothetical protein ACQE3E_06590 [Methylomonas sp. MED-D]|uniref:hypothetical protein n=1 Tax=Methylomonas sp. MED-D TaxID=3418768 RepID=UPI003CFFA754